MIVVYLLVFYANTTSSFNPIPPMADLESCERVRAAISKSTARESSCVRAIVPASSDKAWFKMENK